jgi:exonuclease VII small subunit
VSERDALVISFRPWTRRLAVEDLARWVVRGGIAALAAAAVVLSIGWFYPWPTEQLKPIAVQVAGPLLLVGLIVGIWPHSRLSRAAQLDTRLTLADRLATAWNERRSTTTMAVLQRQDALLRLAERTPKVHLKLKIQRYELGALIGVALVATYLSVAQSPMKAVLDRMAADQVVAEQAAMQIDQLRTDASLSDNLTPEQARKLDELLQQARSDLGKAQIREDAQAVLARAQQQLLQLSDPTSDEREQALGAMSETLSQEPLARSLGDALQRNDPRATQDAINALNDRIDQLSDSQRQGLARALQRASNVGRADSRSSNALRDAARSIANGENADASLNEAATSLEQAMRSAAAQASLRSASQRLDDVRTGLATGDLSSADQQPGASNALGQGAYLTPPSSTAIAIDPSQARPGGLASDGRPVDQNAGAGAGAGQGAGLNSEGRPFGAVDAAESVFVPGRAGDGQSDQDQIQQPFSVRGAPRPYREVIGQYAQNGRDYVDRASVAPSVRELVRQYFAGLEGQ